MITFENFAQKAKDGLVTIKKVNDAFAMTKKCFNPDTGAEIEPEIIALDPKDLETEKQKLLTAMSQIDAVLTEVAKIK